MGNDDGSFSLVEFLQIVHYQSFVSGIQGIGGFIKEQEGRALVYGSGYQDTLTIEADIPENWNRSYIDAAAVLKEVL